jgi:hypothetical protein
MRRRWVKRLFVMLLLAAALIAVISITKPALADEPSVIEQGIDLFGYEAKGKAKIKLNGQTVKATKWKNDENIVYTREGRIVAVQRGKVLCPSPDGLEGLTSGWVTQMAAEAADTRTRPKSVTIRNLGETLTCTVK